MNTESLEDTVCVRSNMHGCSGFARKSTLLKNLFACVGVELSAWSFPAHLDMVALFPQTDGGGQPCNSGANNQYSQALVMVVVQNMCGNAIGPVHCGVNRHLVPLCVVSAGERLECKLVA